LIFVTKAKFVVGSATAKLKRMRMNTVNTQKIDIFATLSCIGALACWSLGPIFIKYLTGYIDSWTQNLLRYSVACLFWLPFLLRAVKRQQIEPKLWRMAILPAAANIAMQSLWAAGFYYVGAAFMALISKSSVIWITGFSLVFFANERGLVKSKQFWLGLILSIAGVIGVIYYKSVIPSAVEGQDFTASGTVTGVIIAIVCSFMWAVYVLSARIAFRDIDSRIGFAVICIYTVVGLFTLGIIFGKPEECLKMGAGPWAAVLISAVTAIALGHVLYYAAMKRIGATIPALVILAQPFVVFAISSVVFNESLNGLQLLFGLALLAGSALAIWSQASMNRLYTRKG
jgi:drug/metabolite transporter (DMT)-like permease